MSSSTTLRCHCGTTFIPNALHQVHCSDSCRVAAANRRYYERNREKAKRRATVNRRKRQINGLKFDSIYDVRIENQQINYTALAFSALKRVPDELRGYVRTSKQWQDVLQAVRLSAVESYINGRDTKQTYLAASRAIYQTLRELGFRRASTRTDPKGRYNYEAVDFGHVKLAPKLHSTAPHPEKVIIAREERQRDYLLAKSVADVVTDILVECGESDDRADRIASALMLAVEGYSNHDIAHRLGLAESTIESYLKDGRAALAGWHEENTFDTPLTTTCRVCSTAEQITIHHIVPRHAGGVDVVENLVSLCRQHHADIENWNIRNQWHGMTDEDWCELFQEWLSQF